MHTRHLWGWVLPVVLGALILHLGCKKSAPTPADGGAREHQTTAAGSSVAVQPSTPEVRCFRLGDHDEAPSVVCIQGYPLVFTGQVFAESKDGSALSGDLSEQLRSAWDRLQAVLQKVGTQKEKIVRINASVTQEDATTQVMTFIRQQFPKDRLPAITTVVTPLPQEGAKVAFDAVAYTEEQPADVKSARLSDDPNVPNDAIVCPVGGLVFFSGQPDKSPLPKAVENSLKALLETAQHLHVEKKDILQLRVFLQPVAEASAVLDELKRAFPEGTMPPVIFTEWIASAPVEIEMVARLPAQSVSGNDVVRFYNPPGVKPSPTFSRVAVAQTDRLIFFPTLLSRKDASGQEQVKEVFDQLAEGLKQAGSDFRHLVKATYCVVDKEASDAIDAIRKELYDPARPPAASKVTIHGVGQAGRTVGVDMIAVPAGNAQ